MRFTSSQPENTDQRYGYTANQRFPVTLLRRKNAPRPTAFNSSPQMADSLK